MAGAGNLLLCIDIGNTNVAIGLYDGEALAHHWRLSTDPKRTVDEYGIALRSVIDGHSVDASRIARTVLSSVVPSLTSVFQTMIRSVLGHEPLLVSHSLDIGLAIDIDNPHELGTDLIANAVAGYSRHHAECVVVDFGTALSFTVVNRSGIILGASIAPGVQSAMHALSRNTDQLPHVPLVPPAAPIGRDTVHAIQSGIIFGYVGLVEGIIGRIRTELGGNAAVIATGGLSGVIAPLTSAVDTVDPWLTLEGLRIIAERNVESG